MDETTRDGVQEMILENIITSGNNSTFIRCTSDNEDVEIKEITAYAEKVAKKLNDPEVKTKLDAATARLKEIFSHSIYCAHCGKVATLHDVTTDNGAASIAFSCDCEESKKEIASKKEILEKRAVIEAEYNKLQADIINTKCLPIFKSHYKEIMEQRYKDFAEYDNCILNLDSITVGE